VPRIPRNVIPDLLARAIVAASPQEKGRVYEDLICEIFGRVPGIEITARDVLNPFGSEEVDVALWNDRSREGLHFLPNIILIECKNWSSPVGSREIDHFASKLRHRGCDHGFLIAANGISGQAQGATSAYQQVLLALAEGIRVVVFTTEDLHDLSHTDQLVFMVKRKLCELVATGSTLP
jgi:hypothetical protein